MPNGMYVMAMNEEDTAAETGLVKGVGDFIQYGLTSAAASAGIGIYNTFAALGDSLGGETTRLDEQEFIKDSFGQSTADYYGEHKGAIDTVGMLGSMLIPGTIALKGIKVASSVGLMGNGLRAATGMENAGVFWGSRAVQAAKESVQAGAGYSLANPAVRAAAVAAGTNAAAETVVFTLANSLMNNQNAGLNPDKLSYWDSSLNLMKEDATSLLNWGFFGVTAGYGVMRTGGILKEIRTGMDKLKGKELVSDLGAIAAIPNGSAAYLLTREIDKLTNDPLMDFTKRPDLQPFEKNFLEKEKLVQINQLTRERDAYVAKVMEGKDNDSDIAPQLAAFLKGERAESLDGVANVLANLTKAGRITPAEASKQRGFTSASYEPLVTVVGAESGLEAVDKIFDRTKQILAANGKGVEALKLDRETFYKFTNKGDGAYGMTVRPDDNRSIIIKTNDENGNPVIIPRSWAWQRNIQQDELDLYNVAREDNGLTPLSLEEKRLMTVLHELSHFKNNPDADLKTVMKSFVSSRNGKAVGKGGLPGQNLNLAEQLIKVSQDARPQHWSQIAKELGTNDPKELAKIFTGDPSGPYMGRATELLADAGAMLLTPDVATAMKYSKLAPDIAKMFKSHPGLRAPWDQRKAFLNIKTGEVKTNHLPRVADLNPVRQMNGSLHVMKNGVPNQIERIVPYDSSIFDSLSIGKIDSPGFVVGSKEFDEQWTLANMRTAPLTDDGVASVASWNDAPLIESYLSKESLEPNGLMGIKVGDEVLTLNEAKSRLIDWKKEKLDTLLLQQRYSADDMAHILNISPDTARLANGSEEDWLQFMKGRDYSQPEYAQLSYSPIDVSAVDQSSRTEAAIQARQAVVKSAQDTASAQVLGKESFNMVEAEALERNHWNISTADSRQGKVFGMRPEFGTLRDMIAQIGKAAGDMMTSRTQKIEENFKGFFQNFNHPNAVEIRAQLAAVDTMIRREWHTLRKVPTAESVASGGDLKYQTVVIKKSTLDELAEQGVDFDSLDTDSLRDLVAGKADAMFVKKEVGQFLDYHFHQNNARVESKRALAGANGRQRTALKSDVLYPPPRDLKQSPFYMFVMPSKHHATLDDSRFMIFANSSAELAAKKAAILQKHGTAYQIVAGEDVKTFKTLQGDYNDGKVFSEMEFDSSLQREFKDSELAPNLDVTSSGTLERYRYWHQRQEEGLVRQAVETKYASTVEFLDRMDKQSSQTGNQNIAKKYGKEEDSIYADSKRVMLAVNSRSDDITEAYKQVSSIINDKGSKIVDGVLKPFTSSGKEFTLADMEAANKAVEAIGFKSPFEDAMAMFMASPETVKSRSLPTLVRFLNTLSSTTMITLDSLASIVNGISSPIISLPVVREALQSISREKVEQLVTVVNPANGMREPTAQKLLMDASQKFWTKEGKEFLDEMRARNIVRDPLVEYREAQDLADFNGAHSLGVITGKIEKLRAHAGKYTQAQRADEFSKFMTAWSVKQIAEVRGITGNEMWSVISSSVDKTQGVFRATQRGELWNGVVGQAVGLYQSYVFNWLQTAGRNLERGQKGNLVAMAAMQTSLFGVRSMPGFDAFNAAIGERNRNNEDLYTFTQATEYDEEGNPVNPWGQYLMYGMGSHAFGFPIDIFNRGDMNPRQGQPLFVPNPTDIEQYPAINMVVRSIANLMNVASAAAGGGDLGQAMIHGLAHNAMNRPLQGLGTIIQGRVTSNAGTTQFADSNYVNGDMLMGLDGASIAARLLGSRPTREAILTDEMYRQKAYDVSDKEQVSAIGTALRMKATSGQEITGEDYDDFAVRYEAAGGKPQNFNAFMTRTIKGLGEGQVMSFKNKLSEDRPVARSYKRMLEEQSSTPLWDLYPPAVAPVAPEM